MLCNYMVDGPIFLSMAANSGEKKLEEKPLNFLEDNKIPYCLIDVICLISANIKSVLRPFARCIFDKFKAFG